MFPTVDTTSFGPFMFVNLKRVQPPPVFRDWWVELEDCTGMEGDFDAMGWYFADRIYKWGEAVLAIYFETPPEVIIQRNRPPEQLEDIVKHEALHHFLAAPGRDQHIFGVFTHCLPLEYD